MGAIYEAFEQELQRVGREFAGRPRQEMLHLFFLALEREELAAIAYRESPMVERLRAMPIEAESREIIRHAMVWIWKDEEMHAVYIRGAIFRLGPLLLRCRALGRQLAGWAGGWSSSALIHTRWSQAPLTRLTAKLVAALGRLAGKIPPEIRQYLSYGPFRRYCRFSIDAEKTAWRCWKRLVELAASQAEVDSALVEDFRRIMCDEELHARIFEILFDALDDDDRLIDGQGPETIAARIATVGECFLPRARRSRSENENPLGSGGRVWCFQGRGSEEKRPLLRRLLDDSGLQQQLLARAGSLGKPLDQLRIAIKPTFMLGYHRRDPSPLTDPLLLEDLARYLHEQGCGEIAVVEGRNIYDRYYGNRAVRQVADYFSIRSPLFRVVDAWEEQVPHAYGRGMGQYSVSQTWKEADFRISFGKLRSHPVELALLTVGNVEWLGARCEDYLFVERQARRETATMMLLDEFPPHFSLLDAYDHVPDGLVGMMGSTRPKLIGRLYAGQDALAVDLIAARHLGINNPHQSSILRAACHWFGGYPGGIEVVGCDRAIPGWRSPFHNELSTLLSVVAMPMYVLASGRGALFVPEMDEHAFPPLRRETTLLRLTRQGVRTILGLHHSRQGTRQA